MANRNPAFSGGARTFSVAENTPPGDVGSLVAALDPDGDVTYTSEGTDADSFDIIATNGGGQIRTSAPLNHEEKSSYSVAVRVRDGRGGTDAVNVTIRVTDVDRGPGHAVRADGDGGIEHELAGELGRAGQHRPAHNRLRLPVPGQ